MEGGEGRGAKNGLFRAIWAVVRSWGFILKVIVATNTIS